jgi:hypothetical protein
MKRLGLAIVFVFSLSLLASGFAVAADDSKVKNATNQVESGAKKIPDGKVGEGVEETVKGIGKTVSDVHSRLPRHWRHPAGAKS